MSESEPLLGMAEGESKWYSRPWAVALGSSLLTAFVSHNWDAYGATVSDAVVWLASAFAPPGLWFTCLGLGIGVVGTHVLAPRWRKRVRHPTSSRSEALIVVRRVDKKALALEAHCCTGCGLQLGAATRADPAVHLWRCLKCRWEIETYFHPHDQLTVLSLYERGKLHA